MHFTSVLIFATSVAILAMPHPQDTFTTVDSDTEPFPSNTTITFYQGLAAPAGSSNILYKPAGNNSKNAVIPGPTCGIPVATGTMKASYCTIFLTAKVGIRGSGNGSCSLTLFSGSASCSDGFKTVVQIPNGQTETCIGTGVLDGGKFEKSSGIWACG